jgi:hypothetical protein
LLNWGLFLAKSGRGLIGPIWWVFKAFLKIFAFLSKEIMISDVINSLILNAHKKPRNCFGAHWEIMPFLSAF